MGARARLILHARKAYGPWRACASVCAYSHVCGVCVCAALHCTVLVCTVLRKCWCKFLTTSCARGVCGACIARVMCACSASARVRGLAFDPGCGITSAAMGLASLVLEEQRQELDVEDFEDVDEDVDVDDEGALEELEYCSGSWVGAHRF